MIYISLFCCCKDCVDSIHSFPGLHLPAAVLEVAHVVALAHYHLQTVNIRTEFALQVGEQTAEESYIHALLEQDVLLNAASYCCVAFAQRGNHYSVELRVSLWRQPNADHILQLSQHLFYLILWRTGAKHRLCYFSNHFFDCFVAHCNLILWMVSGGKVGDRGEALFIGSDGC